MGGGVAELAVAVALGGLLLPCGMGVDTGGAGLSVWREADAVDGIWICCTAYRPRYAAG